MNSWCSYTEEEKSRLYSQKVIITCVKIQYLVRRYLAKKRVKVLKQRFKYEKLYDATIIIQKVREIIVIEEKRDYYFYCCCCYCYC